MRNSKYKNWKYIALTLALLIAPFAAQIIMAQPPPPPPPPPPPSGVPIDGGLALLLGALGVYGAKKIFNKK